MKVYLAAPIGEMQSVYRDNAERAKLILEKKGCDVYAPWNYRIPNAWDYPNTEWGLMVFANDIKAINDAEMVVVLSYGRLSTAGTNWECGYAYGINKTVIVVEMTHEVMSLMVSNGCFARISSLDQLFDYNFDLLTPSRTKTEQK